MKTDHERIEYHEDNIRDAIGYVTDEHVRGDLADAADFLARLRSEPPTEAGEQGEALTATEAQVLAMARKMIAVALDGAASMGSFDLDPVASRKLPAPLRTVHALVGIVDRLASAPPSGEPTEAEMRCKHLKPGGASCGMHNLHCGAPDCMVPVDPPERVSEQAHGCTCPIAWRPPHDPKCPAHGRVSEASALREALVKALGADDFSPGLDALAGTVRYHEIEDGRWSDLSALYSTLVDIRRRALEDTKEDG